MKKIKLLIFDIGGVFRDSSKAINEGFRRGFVSYNLSYNFNSQDVWRLRGIGKYNNSKNCIKALFAILKTKYNLSEIIRCIDAENILDKIINENYTKDDEKVIDGIRKVYKKFFNSPEALSLIKLYPNVKNAINLLSDKGYKLAIFTNSNVRTVKRDLKELDLGKFSLVLSEEDVKNKKPSGEGILKIISKLNVEPNEAAYVGDCVVDIQAAKDARCNSIALLCGMGLKIHLEKEKPDLIFENLWEMSKYF